MPMIAKKQMVLETVNLMLEIVLLVAVVVTAVAAVVAAVVLVVAVAVAVVVAKLPVSVDAVKVLPMLFEIVRKDIVKHVGSRDMISLVLHARITNYGIATELHNIDDNPEHIDKQIQNNRIKVISKRGAHISR